ncbi:MAG TPA: SDR family oxidoreductase [Pseudonocardia sp.]|nr:SDR family oxidoreductase [Pseudonocardia sp.]
MTTTAEMTGRVVVLTGGTSGLGAAAAEEFAARGARVVIAGRRVEQGLAVATRLGPSVEFCRADVAEPDQVRSLIEGALDRHGRLDCLVNNAGGGGNPGPIGELDLELFRDTLDVHVLGMAAGIKYAARPMIERGAGSIINVASVGGALGGWTPLDYAVAKAAVVQLTRCAAVELGEHGVRVNSISPGPIPTGIQLKSAGASGDDAERNADSLRPMFAQALRDWQPMRRIGEPADVASVMLWLAGDGAGFVNGQDIAVDGGILAGRPASVAARDYAALSALV